MWFKKKDKNSFEYEIFAKHEMILTPRETRREKKSGYYTDVIRVKVYFKNKHLNISKVATMIEDTIESFKPDGTNFHVLSMSRVELEEKYVRPTIVKELKEILNKKENNNEIQSILDNFNMKGSIKIEEGEYENN